MKDKIDMAPSVGNPMKRCLSRNVSLSDSSAPTELSGDDGDEAVLGAAVEAAVSGRGGKDYAKRNT